MLSFENNAFGTGHTRYFLPTEEIKDYNVMIDGKNFFDHPVKNDLRKDENIRKIATSQGGDYTTGCLLEYPFFKGNYKMIAIDLSKQKALDVDLRAILQISFTGNLDRDWNTTMFLKQKKLYWNFSQGTLKVL